MNFVKELTNTEEFMNEADISSFQYSVEYNVKRIHKIWLDNEKNSKDWNFPREYCGYYGKRQPSLGAAAWIYGSYDDKKAINDGALCCKVNFLSDTHNGCKVLDYGTYYGSVCPFQTLENAEDCRKKIDDVLNNMGFVKRTTRVEKVYFSSTRVEKVLFFKNIERNYDKEPSYIVYVHVAW